jgi:hypothetical protein
VPSLHDGRVRNGTQITPSEDDWVGLASPPSLIQQDGEASLVEPQNSCRTARRCANENAKIKDPDYHSGIMLSHLLQSLRALRHGMISWWKQNHRPFAVVHSTPFQLRMRVKASELRYSCSGTMLTKSPPTDSEL